MKKKFGGVSKMQEMGIFRPGSGSRSIKNIRIRIRSTELTYYQQYANCRNRTDRSRVILVWPSFSKAKLWRIISSNSAKLKREWYSTSEKYMSSWKINSSYYTLPIFQIIHHSSFRQYLALFLSFGKTFKLMKLGSF